MNACQQKTARKHVKHNNCKHFHFLHLMRWSFRLHRYMDGLLGNHDRNRRANIFCGWWLFRTRLSRTTDGVGKFPKCNPTGLLLEISWLFLRCPSANLLSFLKPRLFGYVYLRKLILDQCLRMLNEHLSGRALHSQQYFVWLAGNFAYPSTASRCYRLGRFRSLARKKFVHLNEQFFEYFSL